MWLDLVDAADLASRLRHVSWLATTTNVHALSREIEHIDVSSNVSTRIACTLAKCLEELSDGEPRC